MWPSRREQKMTASSEVSTLKHEENRVSLGDELRSARAARGLSLSDVETDLRIKSYYIEAIESGDLTALPDKVYVDGFVRNYASYLQLAPEETLARFDEETGFAKTARKSRKPQGKVTKSIAVRDPLAGYTPPRRISSEMGGSIGRGLAALWPLVVLGGLGYAIWYGVIAAREAGIIPDNLSVIGSTEIDPPVFSANISDEAIGTDTGGNIIERPADLSYAELGTQPYWIPSESQNAIDGPVSTIDIATVGLFSAHKGALGVNALVRDVSPIDMTPKPPVAVAEIAAETRAALSPAVPADENRIEIAAASAEANGRSFALVALEETWIQVKAPSGKIRFSGILAPGEAFDIPAGEPLALKVGNAGGLVAELGGERFGPFGKRGAVMRDVSLDRQALIDRFTPRVAGTSNAQ